jgi:hypothetical protein
LGDCWLYDCAKGRLLLPYLLCLDLAAGDWVMVRVIKEPSEILYDAVCPCCGAILEFSIKDVIDYNGLPLIQCPRKQCGAKMVVDHIIGK